MLSGEVSKNCNKAAPDRGVRTSLEKGTYIPETLVRTLRNPIVPVNLRIVLLTVEDFTRDLSGDVIGDIITQDE